MRAGERLSFGVRSGFINRTVYLGLQVFVRIGYDLFYPDLHPSHRQTDRQTAF